MRWYRRFLPSSGCLIALAVLVTIMAGLGWKIWDTVRWEFTDVVLDNLPSQDGSLVAVVDEKTDSGFFFAMTFIFAEVHLVTTKPPIRDILLLAVDTGGHVDDRPGVVWSAPNVLRITVPLYSYSTIVTRQAGGVRVDVRFDPDDLPARAAWLTKQGLPPDPPQYRPDR